MEAAEPGELFSDRSFSAKDQRDAVRLASKCPILAGENTSMEVRELADP